MTLFESLRRASPPDVAIELASRRVAAAAIEYRGRQPVVAAHASEPLPPGALVPALAARNIVDRDAVGLALARVLERIGARPRRVGLVVPDLVARVSLVKFEKVPARAQDLDQLVRWQVKKSAPFPLEEAQVSYVPGWRAPDGREFVVAVARRDVVGEYESLCATAGAHAGLVDLATFNIANAVIAGSGGSVTAETDQLLVNVAPEYASIAILRGAELIVFRSRGADADGTLADLVHQTAMYYEDRLKGAGFARVVLAGAAAAGSDAEMDELRCGLEERLGAAVELVDPRGAAAIADRIGASAPLLDTLAPLVGLLVRGREVAA